MGSWETFSIASRSPDGQHGYGSATMQPCHAKCKHPALGARAHLKGSLLFPRVGMGEPHAVVALTGAASTQMAYK